MRSPEPARRSLMPIAALAATVILLVTGAASVNEPATNIAAGGEAVPESGRAVRPAPAPTVRVMSFNTCGAACNDGEVPRTAAYLARTVIAQRSEVVFLQELCRSQFRKIQSLTRTRGYQAIFAAQTRSRRCGGDFGVALLVRGKTWGKVVRRLPGRPGFERRVLLGAQAQVAGRQTFVAVVHTSPSVRAGRPRQLRAVADFLRPYASGPAIVGGDFNTLPGDPGLSGLLSRTAGGTGRYLELDQLRRRPTFETVSRKIDYIFASESSFASPAAAGLRTTMSDHRIYVGTFRAI
ncbi:endonuclease/exonuclease/phosphatase family protein [Actinoplanes friuliensis]|uniref:Endonuclease/exonuclease/phosphatase n=1 Tax=Actinoplanes friuliensis DSM 7358 TaxID=1246995 RepID=U5VUM5_9ACTN|nr:endonuclease/exonuclease/phosphatase family protein [Actinoplanes friuliensis]AGZ40522.1 endonuclease/exonuclease/phosphatase [Actinoplanes friuliensis DSM 7358]